jgi:hypothetical protein
LYPLSDPFRGPKAELVCNHLFLASSHSFRFFPSARGLHSSRLLILIFNKRRVAHILFDELHAATLDVTVHAVLVNFEPHVPAPVKCGCSSFASFVSYFKKKKGEERYKVSAKPAVATPVEAKRVHLTPQRVTPRTFSGSFLARCAALLRGALAELQAVLRSAGESTPPLLDAALREACGDDVSVELVAQV